MKLLSQPFLFVALVFAASSASAASKDFCEVYPVGLPHKLVEDGVLRHHDKVTLGNGSGNFSWLTWSGKNDANTLAQGLVPPGTSDEYVSPYDSSDNLVEIGDWVQGIPGVKNSKELNANLSKLVGKEIIVPFWGENSGSGAGLNYRIQEFGIVELTDYRLGGKGWLSFNFKGFTTCYNVAPVANDTLVTTQEDTAITFIALASDEDNDPLSYTKLSLPKHGILSGDGPEFTYIPSINFVGSDQFTFSVNDGEENSNTATVTITVTPVNDAPVAFAQTLTTAEDTALSITLSGADVDGDVISVGHYTAPGNGIISGEPPTLTYTPNPNFFGDDAFTFTVSDGLLESESVVIKISVTPVNDAPIAKNENWQTLENTTLVGELTATDPEGDELSFEIVSQPSNGVAVLAGNQVTYTPNAGYFGPDNFTFVAKDQDLVSNLGQVTINVIEANKPPVITSTPPLNASEGTIYSYDVEAQDPNTVDELQYALEIRPRASDIDPKTGAISWVPTHEFVLSNDLQNAFCYASPSELKFDPVIKWNWTSPSVAPSKNGVFGPVSVAQFTDDNDDGEINHLDTPDVAFTSGSTSGTGVLNIIDGKTGQEIFSSEQFDVSRYGSLALGDIDSDGIVEIVVAGGDGRKELLAFEHDGTLKWRAATGPYHSEEPRDAIALADIDADGNVEIIHGANVFDANGNLLWSGDQDSGGYQSYGYLSFAADIDLDGFQEIIAGRTVYDYQGNVLWHQEELPSDGFNAVGNFDNDQYAEIVLVANGQVHLLEHQGNIIWSVAIPGGGYGGAPTIADFDNDGLPEIGVAGRDRYVVLEHDGAIKWTKFVKDHSSSRTGSSVFDFNQDSRAEVLYADEIYFYVLDGETGDELIKIPNESGTTLEYPVVADIDKDGSADILFGSNFSASGNGLRAYSSQSNSWVATRSIWNQHAYSIENINDDLSIPQKPRQSWLTTNTFRLNSFQNSQPTGLADLVGSNLTINNLDGNFYIVSAEVFNRGLMEVNGQFTVKLYSETDNGELTLLGAQIIDRIQSGERVILDFPDIPKSEFGNSLIIVLDEEQLVSECIENNNASKFVLFGVQVTDIAGLSDEQIFILVTREGNLAPFFEDLKATHNLPVNDFYRYSFKATDINIGDALRYTLLNPPVGAKLAEYTGEFSWQPTVSQIGSHRFAIKVEDLAGYSAVLNLAFTVGPSDGNQPPVITSSPSTSGEVNKLYTYEVQAFDPDNNGALSYSLNTWPEGALIDQSTGIIEWLPLNSGDYEFSVSVTDVEQATTHQSFVLTVTNQFAITSTPELVASNTQNYTYSIETSGAPADDYRLLIGPDNANVIGNVVHWQPNHRNVLEPKLEILSCVDYESLVVGSPGSHVLTVESHHMAGVLPKLYGTIPDQYVDTSIIDNQKEVSIFARELAAKSWFSDFNTFAYTTQEPEWEGYLTRLVVRNDGEELLGFEAGVYAYQVPATQSYKDRALAFHNDTWARRLSHDVCERENNFGVINGQHNDAWEDCVVEGWGAFSVLENVGQPSKWQADLVISSASMANSNINFDVFNRGLTTSANYRIQIYTRINSTLELIHSEEFTGVSAGKEVTHSYTYDKEIDGDIRIVVKPLNDLLECHVGNSEVDLFKFAVEATSIEGSKKKQQFWLSTLNEQLSFVSKAPLKVYQDANYVYTTAISGGSGQYSFSVSGPNGMEINDKGVLSWSPVVTQVGTHDFVVTVTDEDNNSASQHISLEVLKALNNIAPEITSIAPTQAVVGEQYKYAIEAVDKEGDTLTFALSSGPNSAQINENILTWTPTREEYDWYAAHNLHNLNPGGAYALLEVEVRDQQGLIGRQKWVLNIDLPNGSEVIKPQIVSEPLSSVQAGANYVYSVIVEDSSGTQLDYTLTSWPSGMEINDSGVISWQTKDSWGGEYHVEFSVNNQVGGISSQSFYLSVQSGTGNKPPTISSVPSLDARLGEYYSYQVIAQDADSDPLNFALESSPQGMTINAETGLVLWTPLQSTLGANEVVIVVSDGRGGYATQSFTLNVSDGTATNTLPVISSMPGTVARATYLYRYQIEASDAEGDALTYTLEQAPDGMSIDDAGAISWQPDAQQQAAVRVRVSDGQGYVEQGWTITVNSADTVLHATISASPGFADEGELVTIKVNPINAIAPVTVALEVDGQVVATDSTYSAQITALGIGEHPIKATVTDAYNSIEITASFYVKDPSDLEPPTLAIVAPINNAVVSEPTEVVINVEDTNLANWRLVYFERGTEGNNPIELANGQQNVQQQAVATFDPTMLNNGLYTLVLEAQDVSGQLSQESVNIAVEGDLKVGNFSITFEDVNIAVAGMPIGVTRTYDTRDKHKNLDFGYGWRVDYQNIRIQESRILGKGWGLNEYRSGFFSNWCVEPNGDPIVTITLPDGRVEKFKAKANPHCNQIIPIQDVTLEFEAIEGTTSTLTQKDYGLLRVNAGDLVDLGDPGNAVDPTHYQLITADGYTFDLNEGFTIERITTPTGHTLTYTKDGIIHSGGMSITFERDVNDRIEKILLPDNTSISYEYDESGDLIVHKDQLQQGTEFTYNKSHGLLDIIAANGVRVVRNEYDEQGRLIAQIDADGNRLEFTHELDANRQLIKDRRGNTQVLTYDTMGNVLTQTNALGETITRSYDGEQNVLSMTDGEGNTTAWTYDGNRNKLSETNALNHTVNFSYGNFNRLLTEDDPDGVRLITNEYARDGNIEKSTNALGEVSNFTYDESLGELASLSDDIGTQAAFTYKKYGDAFYIGSKTDADGVVTQYQRDAMGRELSETMTRTLANGTAESLVTQYEYDDKGRLVKTIDPMGYETRTEYDVFDNETAMVDELGRRTEMDYDTRGNHTQTRYPDGTQITKTYDAENNLISETDRSVRVTQYEYDAANRLVKTTYPDASIMRQEYDKAGRMVATVDGRGNRTEYRYDAAGQQIEVKDAHGQVTSYEYDKRGNRIAMVDALLHRYEYDYDLADRLIKTTFPDGTFTTTTYDARGRRTAQTDQAGIITRYHYDGSGRLTKVEDVEGIPTTYTYDELGNKLTQTDALGRTTRWAYDKRGNVLSRTLPLGQTEHFTYDEVGNQLTHTDFNGELTRYEYDTNNRLVKVIYSQGDVETFTYDSNGNRTQASGPQGTWQYEYDAQNRLIKETKPSSEVLAYSYDNNSNKVQTLITYQDGQTRTESADYDALNRLISVAVDGVMQASYGYDDNGNRTSQTNANGTSTTYEYDVLNRLTKVQHYNAQGALIEAFTYTLDDTGRRTKLEQSTGRTSDYGYDNRYRLTSESVTDALQGNYLARFTYDDVGNRLTQTINGETTTYVYDDNDRITSERSATQNTTYSYDDNGNTLAKTIDNAQVQYVYDIRNRMISLDATAVGGDKTDYQYNIDGIRIAKTLNGQATHYLVDNNRDYAQVIAESNDLGTRLKTYLYGDDLLSQTDTSNTTNTYHYDGLGSTRLLSDDSGTQSDSYTYAAFGELLNQTGTTENNFLFAGEQFDGDLDQYYLRARYYDQSVGRFTQQDEWMGRDGEPVTLNKYVYAHADPVNFVDPSGYFGLSDVMGAVNVQGVLTTIGTRAGANAAGRRLLWNGACFVVEEMAEAAISQAVGLYIFDDILVNKPYVGQSKSNIVDRLNSHFRVTRTYIDNVTHVLPVSVAPGVSDKLHDVLDALEQSFIDDFNGPGGKKGQSGGSANKRNQVDVTKDKRKYLKDLMDKFKICPK